MAAAKKMEQVSRRLEAGFREGHSGDLACPHRDVSCCAACEAAHPEIVEVFGQCFWVENPVEREGLRAEVEAMRCSTCDDQRRVVDGDDRLTACPDCGGTS